MLSETLRKELGRYGIGGRLRALRLRKKLGLVELGRHTGLSPALLSKLETGRLVPTLPTLQRIALVFGVGLDHFFVREEPVEPVAIHHRKERMRFPDRADARRASFEFESLDFKALDRPLSAYYAEFRAVPDDRPAEHAHPGVELIYLMSGSLGLKVAGNEVVLARGDSAYLDASRPHAYRRIGKARCTAVVITVPRTEQAGSHSSAASAPPVRPATAGGTRKSPDS
jgi:transcriptional regulator with XRE-family HTH domain